MLVIPGGAGTRRIMTDERILTWTRGRAADAELVLTVCTGALVAGGVFASSGLRIGSAPQRGYRPASISPLT
ncbi:MAG: two component transcriptional regulator, AraC family [Marmoricola sp.]|nr:two component transcriptional regulator, AraC family [Marmoricola sp.]